MRNLLAKNVKFIFILSLFGFIACTHEAANAQETANYKIITYNILEGFRGEGNRLEKAVKWIKNEDPDVIALQECNGFTMESLKEAAALWGHPYYDICKLKGYSVAITSKRPIKTLEKRLKDMHHGYLHCKISGINYFVVHLSPGDYNKRLSEADILTKKTRELMSKGEKVVVLGDFNALSAVDEKYLESKKETINRFGSEDDYFGFKVMDKFDKAGLQDIAYKHLKNTNALDGSASTMLLKGTKDYRTEEYMKSQFRRIDFILMDTKTASMSVSASIPINKDTDAISDHYPVIVTLHLDEITLGKF